MVFVSLLRTNCEQYSVELEPSYTTTTAPNMAWPARGSCRDQLEDKFFRLKEEHLSLKRDAHLAEYQVKCLNTKLSRLINEKKALFGLDGRSPREVELEELVFDMNIKLEQLARENARLRDRQLVLQAQLSSPRGFRPSSTGGAYAYVRAKVDTGLRSQSARGSSRSNLASSRSLSTTSLNRVHFDLPAVEARPQRAGSAVPLKSRPAVDQPFAINLLHEARDEIQRLEDVIVMQQAALERAQTGGQFTRDASDDEFGDTAAQSHSSKRRDNGVSTGKGLNGSTCEFRSPEHSREVSISSPHTLGAHKKTHTELASYVEQLRQELEAEKAKNSGLRQQAASRTVAARRVDELAAQVKQLEEENKILRDYFEKCLGQCLSEMTSDASNTAS